MPPRFAAVFFALSGSLAVAAETNVPSVASAALPPPVEVSRQVAHPRVTHSTTVTSDWLDGREEAWRDARRKAFEQALGPYRITGSSIAIKGALRRVKLHIEWAKH